MGGSIRKLVCLLAIFSILGYSVGLFRREVSAASITTVAVALEDETPSATGIVTITFTPVTAITTGSIIEVSYDTGFTGGAALVDADVAVAGTNITSTVESGFVAGYFKSTLTTSGSVTTTVTITIDGTHQLTNPGTVGNYNWSLTVDIGGAGTTFDYGAGLAYVGNDNDVLVTATVPAVIDMELYQTGSDTKLTGGSGGAENLCNLHALSPNAVNTCNYDIGTATNNSTGLTVRVTSDGTFDDGSGNTIDACSGTNCNGKGAAGVTAGQEEYGFVISHNGGAGNNIYTPQGSYGTADQAVPTSATSFATISSNHDYVTAGQSVNRMEITHKASMDLSTRTGYYTQITTYTAFTN